MSRSDDGLVTGKLDGRLLAIVSGKGGSGKTMIAAEIADVVAKNSDLEVILLDADLGTGGLSYYLGLHYIRNIRNGLTDLLLKPQPDSPEELLQRVELPGYGSYLFLPVGDFRKLHSNRRLAASDAFPVPHDDLAVLGETLNRLRAPKTLVIVDCRGGVDSELAEICSVVDEILLISEADATSFQATRHVAEALADLDLGRKITGFILNKVLEDPAVLLRSASSAFGAQFLGAIPFDLDATKSFLVGDLPSRRSIFALHVQEAISKAYPKSVDRPIGRVWQGKDYANLSLRTRGESLAGLVFALTISVLGLFSAINLISGVGNLTSLLVLTALLSLCGLIASIDASRKLVGAMLDRYFGSAGGRSEDWRQRYTWDR